MELRAAPAGAFRTHRAELIEKKSVLVITRRDCR
jgi:hypothetical protein